MPKRFDYLKIYNFVRLRGDTLQDKTYRGPDSQLEILCSCGKTFTATFEEYKQGKRCQKCGKTKSQQKKKGRGRPLMTKFDVQRDILNRFNYKILSDYRGCNEKITIKCPRGHIYETTLTYFNRGRRCECCRKEDKRAAKKFLDEQLKDE